MRARAERPPAARPLLLNLKDAVAVGKIYGLRLQGLCIFVYLFAPGRQDIWAMPAGQAVALGGHSIALKFVLLVCFQSIFGTE